MYVFDLLGVWIVRFLCPPLQCTKMLVSIKQWCACTRPINTVANTFEMRKMDKKMCYSFACVSLACGQGVRLNSIKTYYFCIKIGIFVSRALSQYKKIYESVRFANHFGYMAYSIPSHFVCLFLSSLASCLRICCFIFSIFLLIFHVCLRHSWYGQCWIKKYKQ